MPTTHIKLGKYKHYKAKAGQLYEVIGVAKHSETLEELVIYRALYSSVEFEEGTLWARPISMFMGKVNIGGQYISRFEYMGGQ